MSIEQMIIAGLGLFSIAGAVFDWDFFMGSSKAQFFVRLLGRGGARIFYIVLGVGILVLAKTLFHP